MRLNQPNSPLSVSQLNRQVKQLLETQYPQIPVQGEISTLSRPASGHIYFTLKDQNSQIRCAMFKGSLAKSRYAPKQGDEVVVYGRVSLYEGRGDYQLIASQMQPVGEGALQAAFFQMKEKLNAEGLFDAQFKQAMPETVGKVGIVTSSTGAALHDILTVLNRRFPSIEVILYPSQVQGNMATQTICQAIEAANRRKEVDVLIVGRGGGSLEDLWCFNTEPVARAIFNSKLPIISAVGHEVDVSIADFVADVRAATPSQAAEYVSPDQFELMQQLDQHERRLTNAAQNAVQTAQTRLKNLMQRLKSPAEVVHAWQDKLTALTARLQQSMQRPLSQQQEKVEFLHKRLQLASPAVKIKHDQETLANLSQRLNQATQQTLLNKQNKFAQLVGELNILSPLSTLERGYSITKNSAGKVIQSESDVKAGDEIETQLKSGKMISVVTRTEQ